MITVTCKSAIFGNLNNLNDIVAYNFECPNKNCKGTFIAYVSTCSLIKCYMCGQRLPPVVRMTKNVVARLAYHLKYSKEHDLVDQIAQDQAKHQIHSEALTGAPDSGIKLKKMISNFLKDGDA